MASHTRVQRIESFHAHPDSYRHWTLSVDGPVATLTMDVKEENGLRPDDYVLKQNSYDLGVDIELADAIQRLRFEHPAVRVVMFDSAQPKVFCAGANIRMLATSTHGFKVNFCRYTNETRCSLEDASEHSGLRSIAALNGTAAGGGYELALACDEIYLVDDGSSAVSLPEVPLLGVLPGTGGLTRLVDKRKVRRDVADLFCTKAEGFRARDAERLALVDGSFPRSKWEEGVATRAKTLADRTPDATEGIQLSEVTSELSEDGLERTYEHVTLRLEEEERVAYITMSAPTEPAPASLQELRAQGDQAWLMRAFRELDDALLHLRFNHDKVGTILLYTRGDADKVLEHDALVLDNADDWLTREIRLYQARVFRRMDNTARSMFAIIDEGSCFAGSLLEIALAADRSYMLEDEDGAVTIRVTQASAGAYPMSTGITRLQARFPRSPEHVEAALTRGEAIDAPTALDMGLVTLAPDDIDWEDEIRIAVEERASLSPDALTGMEQNLRFVGAETCDSKIFGRLSAWQNWIFQRPNAVGDEGALTLYGHPTRPSFDWRRT
ncbi:MAG: 2,3-epoxybenzoyl-CoA dihydrolase [Myxococcales bacterium]|nr:2,3-epoxybenzoyl-CoA dihydrolase [Myxococcales bacterium]